VECVENRASNAELGKDKDMEWIVDLLKTHKTFKPTLTKFENTTQQDFYKEYDNFYVAEGQLYRKEADKTEGDILQRVIPADEVEKAIQVVHGAKYTGHFGKKKTYMLLRGRIYRPKLRSLVNQYVKTCDVCQKIKSGNKPMKAMLHPIWTNRVNETIATDFAGPFPITDRKNKYIMVITDLYGKVLAVHAMPNKETITAARVLVDEWFCRYGIPDRILSDKGKEYTSQLWDALCEMLDVERLTTTPGHPEGDGQAEKAV